MHQNLLILYSVVIKVILEIQTIKEDKIMEVIKETVQKTEDKVVVITMILMTIDMIKVIKVIKAKMMITVMIHRII
jgi:hypothetical protein